MPPSPTTPSGPAAEGSASSSTGSPTGPSLVADAGPIFDPGGTAPPTPPDGEAPKIDGGPGWTRPMLRSMLEAQGVATHSFVALGPKVGEASTEWLWTEEELSALVPALARILNRIPAAKAAAAGGDAFTVGLGFIGYGARSIAERQAIANMLRAQGHDQAAAEVEAYAPDDAADGDGMPEIPPLAPRSR